jgi:hypothetical protein
MNQPIAEKQQSVVGWIFGGMFTLIGLLFLVIGGFQLRQGLKTNDWPATAGRIIESKVSGSSERREPGSRFSSKKYTVRVLYSYHINGQKFEGDRLRYGNKSYKSWVSAKDEQLLFPAGKEVQVYYDPMSPHQSVLIKGIGLSWLALALGLMGFVIGLSVMFHMARAKTAQIR